jgi:AraC-like DNA-binding protein
MSRTSFAVHFKAVAGVAPLAYLMHWRMRLAERALRDDGAPVSVVARRLGYASESAFSHAFKRVTGYAPQCYRAVGAGGVADRCGFRNLNAVTRYRGVRKAKFDLP